ncbi:Vacuolar protein sorting-associated protein vps5 [Recurvomyces mirabilis]|uniref:Vacuolar protein sorting-associated protein vps5 n=1 Tax=Recurvomyces mirabilis TaxID=574656 RepID=A0AAE1C1K9_9PEZI|nr:Vacuolar protein sorting-associated protein vps5 [Recurvomyces mirabilis]KAK5157755.1 Vacuolar protein sorting-associated protein vps5 [Recurvomyces mirabilis]
MASIDVKVDTTSNPWGAMDEGDSPWSDVPSRTGSNHDLPTAAEEASTPSKPTEPSVSLSPAGAKPAPNKSRTPRRYGNLAQSTTLQSLDDDSLGPLGPLGAEPAAELAAPAPPVKELATRTKASSRPSTAASAGDASLGSDDSTLNGHGRAYQQPLRQPQQPPSLPIEQASKPTFSITVGDPHTVGNATNSHTVYTVITRTTSKAYNNSAFTVTRRYRDFLWLYERLHDNSPGVVVPPPPEKQQIGRFDTQFIESRRMALERMVNKIAAHPVLQHDGDLKTFLESEAFNVDIKHKDRARDPLLAGESKGFMSSIGISSGSGGKFIEHDDWFHDRRIYLDALEIQLKALQKSTDTVMAQRKGLSDSCGDFSTSLHQLAAVELSPSLSGPLDALGDLQIRIQELYTRQAMQDMLTLGIVIDEYIRLIGSIKKAFEQRQKAFHSWHSSESKLQDIKKGHEKLLRAGRTQQDRIQQMQADVAEAERRVHQSRLLFEDMGRLMRGELERFEREKVEDFKSGVETFLESAVEAQKELIELWETYLYQLDTDEDGPPVMPAGIRADDAAAPKAAAEQHEDDAATLVAGGAEEAGFAAPAETTTAGHDEAEEA